MRVVNHPILAALLANGIRVSRFTKKRNEGRNSKRIGQVGQEKAFRFREP